MTNGVANLTSGVALFESGLCINNAIRFRDMHIAYLDDDARSLRAYFQWEIDSLTIYAKWCASCPLPVYTHCPSCVDTDAAVLIQHPYVDGSIRCIRCGLYFDFETLARVLSS